MICRLLYSAIAYYSNISTLVYYQRTFACVCCNRGNKGNHFWNEPVQVLKFGIGLLKIKLFFVAPKVWKIAIKKPEMGKEGSFSIPRWNL